MALSSKQTIACPKRNWWPASANNPWLALALAALLPACSTTSPTTSSPGSNTVTGPVTKIHDGDSIHITPPGQKRVIIRFSAIDAPELKQAAGIASRDQLRSLLTGKTAQARCHKKDKYQRNVCSVHLGQMNIGLKMIETGHAWHYTQYQNEQSPRNRKQYQRAEAKARKSRTGLWSANTPIAPWDFRSQ